MTSLARSLESENGSDSVRTEREERRERHDESRTRRFFQKAPDVGRKGTREGDGDKIPGRRRGEMCRVVDWGGHVVSVVEGAVDEGG